MILEWEKMTRFLLEPLLAVWEVETGGPPGLYCGVLATQVPVWCRRFTVRGDFPRSRGLSFPVEVPTRPIPLFGSCRTSVFHSPTTLSPPAQSYGVQEFGEGTRFRPC